MIGSCDKKYSTPKRAELRVPRVHKIATSNNLKFVNSNNRVFNKTKRIKELEMKIQILKEILRFKKAQNRFLQKSKELESSKDVSKPLNDIVQKPNDNLETPVSYIAPPVPVIPKAYTFKLNPEFPLDENLKPFANIVVELMSHVYAPAFNIPVDYVALNIPDYPKKIKKPMDLGTIKFRLENGKYHRSSEIIQDIRQVWSNAMLYNPPGNTFHVMAKIISDTFENRLKDLNLFSDHNTNSFIRDVDFSNYSRSDSNQASLKDYDLNDSDYDPATGDIIELTVYEKSELKAKISNIADPKVLGVVIEIIRSDPKHKNLDSSRKLEFDVNSLSTECVRRLYKYVQSIPNLKKTVKSQTLNKMDPGYHLKQINTKISNEFDTDRASLIDSVKNNNSFYGNSKTSSILSSSANGSSEKNSVKNGINYKLLDDSSSETASDGDEEFSPKTENVSLGNDSGKSSGAKSAKVMWNWNPNAMRSKSKAPPEPLVNSTTPFKRPAPPMANANSLHKRPPVLQQPTASWSGKSKAPFVVGGKVPYSSFYSVKASAPSKPEPPPQQRNWFAGNRVEAAKKSELQVQKEHARKEREMQSEVNIDLQRSSFFDLQKRFE